MSIKPKKRKNPKTSILAEEYGISDRTGDYTVLTSSTAVGQREIVVHACLGIA